MSLSAIKKGSMTLYQTYASYMVRLARLELARKALPPEDSASTNSATAAA